ncbi:MAG: MlaD family protein [Planctomycetota bacterium]|nr:MlaD family protein [Planctomycetota bacterium]
MNKTLPTANVSNSQVSSFSAVWLIPTIAIIVTSVLYIRWEMTRGPLITITFTDAGGLSAESPIIYRGAIVGRIEQVSLDEDLSHVVVSARLDATAKGLARKGTKWWVVRPSISLQGISGLETIFGPRYIELVPGYGDYTYDFDGSTDPFHGNGKNFTLNAASAENISIGTPIYFRGIEVGSITDKNLANNAASVRLQVVIEEQYTPLVHTNTKFWNVSGVSIDADLFGLDLHTGPLASLIRGGIAMATPDRAGKVAPENYAFTLSDTFDDDSLEWFPQIDLLGEPEPE